MDPTIKTPLKMGKHAEWRKLAKKLRRKRLRRAAALKREEIEQKENEKIIRSPTFLRLLEEQEQAEEYQEQEELRIQREQHALWLKREEEDAIRWKELQKKLALAKAERQKQITRIKVEWENEQKRLKELKELKEKQEEEKRLQEEKLKESIEQYVNYGGDMPGELLVPIHTNPTKDLCLFFRKTGSCRFGNSCSRNHIKPTISRVIVISNFYSHYSLEQVSENEYGNDSSLEFENHEMYNHFQEFFFDVLPEMEKFGRVRQFKVCCNQEAHLRGNVYIEYSSHREALKSFRVLQGRYYGGKQLNVEFSNIESWKSAICGLFFKQRCPKGSSCNFLHVFRNPCNMFQSADKDLHRTPPPENNFEFSDETSSRNWRWSESPERIPSRNNGHNDKRSSSKHYTPKRERSISSRSRRKSRSRSRSSSKSIKSTLERKKKSRSRSISTRRSRSRSPRKQSSVKFQRKRCKNSSRISPD